MNDFTKEELELIFQGMECDCWGTTPIIENIRIKLQLLIANYDINPMPEVDKTIMPKYEKAMKGLPSK